MTEQKNGTTSNGDGQHKQQEGRDGGGRFAAGNKGGPGNPFARQTAEMRRVIARRVSHGDMEEIVDAIKERAKRGDVASAKLLMSYSAGTPTPGADPDTLDAHEPAVRRGATATPEDLKALFEALPAALVCAIASAVSEQVRRHMAGEFAEGVKRQEAMDRRGQEASPHLPGPYPGFKADWEPDWLKDGLPEEVARAFEACPLWAPDTSGEPREAHRLGEMMREARRGILDRLAERPEAGGGGRLVPTAVRKRVKR